jgi:hypothetical protein
MAWTEMLDEPDALARAIGEQFLLTRNRLHLSPQQVRQRGGPVPGTIQKFERGRLGVWTQLVEYADALETPLDDMLRAVVAVPPLELNDDERAWLQLRTALPPHVRAAVLILLEQLVRLTQQSPTG